MIIVNRQNKTIKREREKEREREREREREKKKSVSMMSNKHIMKVQIKTI